MTNIKTTFICPIFFTEDDASVGMQKVLEKPILPVGSLIEIYINDDWASYHFEIERYTLNTNNELTCLLTGQDQDPVVLDGTSEDVVKKLKM